MRTKPNRAKGFYTVHQPKSHSAHWMDQTLMIAPKPTEVDLVLELNRMGIWLKDYNYMSHGVESHLTTCWTPKK